jgi:hypothetical protein
MTDSELFATARAELYTAVVGDIMDEPRLSNSLFQLAILMKVLITNHVPDDHLEPLLGLAEILKGPKGGPMCSRAEVLALFQGQQ